MAMSTRSRLTSDDKFWKMNRNNCETNDNNLGGVSNWCDSSSISNFIGKVRLGDRVELSCDNLRYCVHWGIYLGDWEFARHCVVHFIPEDKEERGYSTMKKLLGVNSKDVLVANPIQKIFGLAGGKARINNFRDEKCTPLGAGAIWQEISNQLKQKRNTDSSLEQLYVYVSRISFTDSEYFVNYCRYDYWRINFGLVSEWYTSWWSLPQIRVGDRLEFYRSGYAHWGIFVDKWKGDDDRVVHFAPANGKVFAKKKSSSSQSTAKDKPIIRVDSIEEVLGCEKVRINNGRDETFRPSLGVDILAEINFQFQRQEDGHNPVYRLVTNNCEHFVNSCRYGQHHSDQIVRVKTKIKKALHLSK